MDTITVTPSMLKGYVTIPATEEMTVYTMLCAALRLDKCTVGNFLPTEKVTDVLKKLKSRGYKYTYNHKNMVLTLSPKKNCDKKKCENYVKSLLKKMFPNKKPSLDFPQADNCFIAEGDYKKAALFLVADAIGCDIECGGIRIDSKQKNARILDIIREAGGKIIKTEGGVKAKTTACMKGIFVNAKDICSLVPIISVLLCFCQGESRISGVGKMRMDSGDRLSALVRELSHLGGNIEETSDGMIIHGVGAMQGDTAWANGDGELALALSVAACRCESKCFNICDGKNAAEDLFENFCEIYKSLEE